ARQTRLIRRRANPFDGSQVDELINGSCLASRGGRSDRGRAVLSGEAPDWGRLENGQKDATKTCRRGDFGIWQRVGEIERWETWDETMDDDATATAHHLISSFSSHRRTHQARCKQRASSICLRLCRRIRTLPYPSNTKMLYSTSEYFPIFIPFGVIGYVLLKIVPLLENPTCITSRDVTIIVPTIRAGEEFNDAANNWLIGNFKEIDIIREEVMLGIPSGTCNRSRLKTYPHSYPPCFQQNSYRRATTSPPHDIKFSKNDAILANHASVHARLPRRPETRGIRANVHCRKSKVRVLRALRFRPTISNLGKSKSIKID
ncbi:hypothetical protein Hypma_002986, partial [Hypsizygus marmoreus]